MNTKIKGEAIKEGSIDSRAFNDELRTHIGYIGTLNIDNPVLNLPQSYNVYYLNGVEIGPYGTIYIAGLIPVTYEVSENKGVLKGTFPEGIDINIKVTMKKRIELDELPSNISDWNAIDGDVGYIKNKPFGFNDTNYTKFNYNGTAGEFDAGYINSHYYGNLHLIYDDNSEIELKISDINGIENAKQIIGPLFVYVNDDKHLIIKSNSTYRTFDIIFSAYSNIKPINDKYLPNTVIKTTPQTLTDENKNQALANLGIDPVVWKYMCDPFILQSGRIVPDELIIQTNEGYDFKYKYPSMFKSVPGWATKSGKLVFDYANCDRGELLPVQYYNEYSVIKGCGNEWYGDETVLIDDDRNDGCTNTSDYTAGMWAINKDKRCYLTV